MIMMLRFFTAAVFLFFTSEAFAQYVVGDYVHTCPSGLPWNDPRCIREPVDRGDESVI